jgi:hypothetical protein
MARLAVAASVVVLLEGSAPANVVVDPGAPFTADELSAALAVRGGNGQDVTVRVLTATAVELRTPAGGQRVELGDARGVAAARLVALQVAPTGVGVELPLPGPVAPEPSWLIGAAVGGGIGPNAIDFGLATVRAHVTRASGRWRLGGAAAWMHGITQTGAAGRAANAELGIVRAQAGLVAGPFELLGGPELIVYDIDNATRTTAGLGASARVRVASTGRWHLHAGVDVDAVRHRVEVAVDGMPFAAIPRVALTAAIGLEWEAR